MDDSNNDKLSLKIVYYGPAMSGKTTNLLQLHTHLSPQRKGELMVMETRDDRTLFFDMLPIGFRGASGLDLRLKLYTVPGQVQHDSTRKAVLSRADGVIFVADSSASMINQNLESLRNLEIPLNWQAMIDYVGATCILKDDHGGGWKEVVVCH